jgi:hypothetical protein
MELPLTSEAEEPARNHPDAASSRVGEERLATSQRAGHRVDAQMLLDPELRVVCPQTMEEPSDLSLPWPRFSLSS